MEIKTGVAYTAETVVDKTNIASAVGSGLADVFSTPMMIALMELAASKCLEPFLGEGYVSVGGHVNVSHTSATPIGMKVTATAVITAVDRRRVDFSVSMRDGAGEIGGGMHTRFIVERDKFTAKANEKLK